LYNCNNCNNLYPKHNTVGWLKFAYKFSKGPTINSIRWKICALQLLVIIVCLNTTLLVLLKISMGINVLSFIIFINIIILAHTWSCMIMKYSTIIWYMNPFIIKDIQIAKKCMEKNAQHRLIFFDETFNIIDFIES
jgi:hypothetical protein